VQAGPWFGTIKRVVGVGEADPAYKGFVSIAFELDPVDGAVCGPWCVVECFGQAGVPGLSGAFGVIRVFPIEFCQVIAIAACMKELS